MEILDTSYVILLRPKFKQPIRFEIGPNQLYQKRGFIQAVIEKRYLFSIFHLFFSIGTLGLFWIHYYRNLNEERVIKALEMGYEVFEERDKEVLKILNITNKVNRQLFKNYLPISRLGSCDHLISK